MDTEDGDFTIEGTDCSPDTVLFDSIVGAIEDYMVNIDAVELWRLVPVLHTVPNDHDRHTEFREFTKRIEEGLDSYVMKACADLHGIDEASSILESRSEEVSDDAWDFLKNGYFDYASFLEEWKNRKP